MSKVGVARTSIPQSIRMQRTRSGRQLVGSLKLHTGGSSRCSMSHTYQYKITRAAVTSARACTHNQHGLAAALSRHKSASASQHKGHSKQVDLVEPHAV